MRQLKFKHFLPVIITIVLLVFFYQLLNIFRDDFEDDFEDIKDLISAKTLFMVDDAISQVATWTFSSLYMQWYSSQIKATYNPAI